VVDVACGVEPPAVDEAAVVVHDPEGGVDGQPA
jgi:hypothetical protein